MYACILSWWWWVMKNIIRTLSSSILEQHHDVKPILVNKISSYMKIYQDIPVCQWCFKIKIPYSRFISVKILLMGFSYSFTCHAWWHHHLQNSVLGLKIADGWPLHLMATTYFNHIRFAFFMAAICALKFCAQQHAFWYTVAPSDCRWIIDRRARENWLMLFHCSCASLPTKCILFGNRWILPKVPQSGPAHCFDGLETQGIVWNQRNQRNQARKSAHQLGKATDCSSNFGGRRGPEAKVGPLTSLLDDHGFWRWMKQPGR